MKVLLADASETTRAHLVDALRSWGYGAEAFATGSQIWYALETQIAPALVILGDMADGWDTLEICRRARQRVAYPTTYIVTFGKPGQRQSFGEALEAGANDYLIRPFVLEELRLRLKNGERLILLEQELEAAKVQLNSRTLHDPLTGAWQRDTVLEHLEREVVRARREESCVGLLLTDIDNLKKINETFGHSTGDLILKETVSHLRTALRPYDALGRMGSDEFLVILSNCDDARALRVARRVQSSLTPASVPASHDTGLVTMSIGVASNKFDFSTDSETLLKIAETALRTAKSGGANGLAAGQFVVA